MPGKPHHIDTCKGQREAEPRNGVLQMIVGQMRLKLARFRPAARGNRFLLVNIERGGARPFLECRNRIQITQKPDIVFGSSAGVKDPRVSGQRRTPTTSMMPRGLPSARVPGSLRSAGTKPRLTRMMLPPASRAGAKTNTRPFHIGPQGKTGGIHKRFLAIEELGRENNAAKFCAILPQREPARARWQIFGRAGKPGIDRCDQIFFPDLAVELPDPNPIRDRDPRDGEVSHRARCLFVFAAPFTYRSDL